MKQGQVTAAIQELMEKDKELQGEADLHGVLTDMPPPKSWEIHVLVGVPKNDFSVISAALSWLNNGQKLCGIRHILIFIPQRYRIRTTAINDMQTECYHDQRI
ncbi:hypothetical protein PsorP6_016896 [Peronosclerospora sorghi]|uniref:Uncharacterized protein n=1 Tax=Peronosclerospora sorghi TaxID=230839 RepID=A0ACC0WEP0_9STRA|nr:hypothetical protein PsorP6_016896 [Peronosclerospora sorghi]